MKWKDLGTHKEIELVSFIKEYLIEKPETKLFIGTDSQNRGRKTNYALVIVLYNERKGGKVLFTKTSLSRIKDGFNRLFKEIEYSLEIAGVLSDSGISKSLLTIDMDYNIDKKYFSNSVLIAALGWATSLGYTCRSKPHSAAASHAADMLVKA